MYPGAVGFAKYDYCLFRKFENLAIGILSVCWKKNRLMTSDILDYHYPMWGNISILPVAFNFAMESFMAEPACYSELSKRWRGDIALSIDSWKILAFALCPPVFVPLLKFVRKSDTDKRLDEIEHRDSKQRPSVYKAPLDVACCGDKDSQISYLNSLKRGLRSPAVKSIHHSVS